MDTRFVFQSSFVATFSSSPSPSSINKAGASFRFINRRVVQFKTTAATKRRIHALNRDAAPCASPSPSSRGPHPQRSHPSSPPFPPPDEKPPPLLTGESIQSDDDFAARRITKPTSIRDPRRRRFETANDDDVDGDDVDDRRDDARRAMIVGDTETDVIERTNERVSRFVTRPEFNVAFRVPSDSNRL
jgi:alkanesulfonate monooxygenase SsuD/methylene tetrahydromethanopterin reductase-like flavin-dependent oxidoreductase (luciferase family)